MIYIVTTKRNKLVGVEPSLKEARTRACSSQSPTCRISGYQDGRRAMQFYEVVENAAPQPKTSPPVVTAREYAFRGTSYQGPYLDYAHLLSSLQWRQESPKESGWYWSDRGGLLKVRWFEIGWGWSTAVPFNVTPKTAAHLATCRAEVQTDIRWALIDRSML